MEKRRVGRLWRLFVLVVSLAMVGLACNLTPPGSTSASSFDASQAVDPNTEPIQVSVAVDPGHKVTAVMGPDGGTLTTTGADGTRYTLEVPAQALVEQIEISMTPITSMDGIPWKSPGLIGAVQLEPDGQTFYSYVTLTIQPTTEVAPDKMIPVGASGPDKDLYMPLLDPNSNSISLKLDHFSSAGATKGLLADTEPWRQRLGGDVEARLSSIVSREVSLARAQLLLTGHTDAMGSDFWDWLIPTWKKYVLQPRLDAAGESCAAGRLALQTLTSMLRQMELLGITADLGVNFADLMPTVARVCLKEEYELCRDQHIVHRMIPVILGMLRQDELLGLHDSENPGGQPSAMDQVEAQGWDLARKCLQFELQFQSKVTLGTNDGSYTSYVEATVEIRLDESGQLLANLTGHGPLNNTEYDLKPNNCSATGITGGGTFQVLGLNWTAAPPDSNYPYGHVTAIHLTYDPGNTSESATVKCSGAPTVTIPPAPMWTLAYEGMHFGELTGTSNTGPAPSIPNLGSLLGGSGIPNIPGLPGASGSPQSGGQPQTGGGDAIQGSGLTFTAKEWAVLGGDLFAQKEWQTTVNMTTRGTEEGSFELYHKPQ